MRITKHIVLAILIGLLVCSTKAFQVIAAPTAQESVPFDSPATLVNQLKHAGDGPVRISYHHETNQVRYIGASPDLAISQPAALAANVSPEMAARSFLGVYGGLFGLKDQANNLTLVKQSAADQGRTFVKFQQLHKGIPVLGGELVVQLNDSLDLISAQGEILPAITLDPVPVIDSETARQSALAKVAKDYNLSLGDLEASEPELWIYNPAILGGPGLRRNTLVWRIEITPRDLLPIDEFVLVDAEVGAIALHFNQVDYVLNRRTYDANNLETLPGALRCDETDPTCASGDTHEAAAHLHAGDTYNFYLNEHGRDSIDDAGMALISTAHYGSNYANAFWSGGQMVYGDEYGFPLGDDVVAHELTHGVTDYTSELFYFYQSGAINESLSDVWGEFVDLTNGRGTDTAAVRWLMGEDITGMGAIRNMKDPTLFSDPDRIGSDNYYCAQSDLYHGTGDNGGVHINSGVNNKAAYLMTDGDIFNGYTVTGLGISKVADLYYEVQTNLLTSAADYPDLYDALLQACSNLGYSASDCQEVKDALDATEMNQLPSSCPATEAPLCDLPQQTPADLFFDDIESGGGNWSSSDLNWFVPQTTSTIGLAEPYATSGVGNIWGFNQAFTSDTSLAMQNDVTLPDSAFLYFNHSFGFESNLAGSSRYDGGIVEYSVNGGSSWVNAGSLFSHNGYNGTLYADNPWGAIPAFSADSRGYISSRVNLASLAGQNVRFRFRISTDSTVYDYGWFIDDVRVYTCTQPTTDLNLTMSDSPDPVSAGDVITYTVSVSNAGPDTADTVTLTDTLPTGASFVSATGPGWSCSQVAGQVTCTRSSLAVGAAPDIIILAAAPVIGGSSITNTAVVASNTTDPSPGNNAATVSTTVNAVTNYKIFLPFLIRKQ